MKTEATEQLIKLNGYINRYYNSQLKSGDELNTLLQKITGLLYYLESVRSDIHKNFQQHIYDSVRLKDGKQGSVARAENEAHVLYPEMYQLRRIMDSGYEIVGAIRTNISYLKSERSTINSQT